MKKSQETPAAQGPQPVPAPPPNPSQEPNHLSCYTIRYRIDDEFFRWQTTATDQADAFHMFYELHFNPEIQITSIVRDEEPMQEIKLYNFRFMYANELGLYEIDGEVSYDYIAATNPEMAEELFWFRHRHEINPATGQTVRLLRLGRVGMMEEEVVYNPPKRYDGGFDDLTYSPEADGDDDPGVLVNAYDSDRSTPPPANHPHAYKIPEAIMVNGSPQLVRGVYALAQMIIDEGSHDERNGEMGRYADAIVQIVHHSMEYHMKYGAPVSRHLDAELYSYARDVAMFFRFLESGNNGSWNEESLVQAVTPAFGPDRWDVIRTVENWY